MLTKLYFYYLHQCFLNCLVQYANFAQNGALDQGKFTATIVAYGQNQKTITGYFPSCAKYYSASSCDSNWNMYLCFLGLYK